MATFLIVAFCMVGSGCLFGAGVSIAINTQASILWTIPMVVATIGGTVATAGLFFSPDAPFRINL